MICKHEDLSSNPKHAYKKAGTSWHPAAPELWEADRRLAGTCQLPTHRPPKKQHKTGVKRRGGELAQPTRACAGTPRLQLQATPFLHPLSTPLPLACMTLDPAERLPFLFPPLNLSPGHMVELGHSEVSEGRDRGDPFPGQTCVHGQAHTDSVSRCPLLPTLLGAPLHLLWDLA